MNRTAKILAGTGLVIGVGGGAALALLAVTMDGIRERPGAVVAAYQERHQPRPSTDASDERLRHEALVHTRKEPSRQPEPRPDALERPREAEARPSQPTGPSRLEAQLRDRADTPYPAAARLAREHAAPAEAEVPGLALPVEPWRERYANADANPIRLVAEEPVSTFSIDVDTASYANVRRYLNDGSLPPTDAVRTEELINYFDYDYALPEDAARPFRADVALFDSPWDAGSRLLRIGIQGYELAPAARPRANLVFLVDTSGSMASPDKLPLLQRSLRMLVDRMEAEDRIAIVAYAGQAGVVLEPTAGTDRQRIVRALERLGAGGSTAGAAGIREAYRLAESEFDERAINRVILATDGDFNVGISDADQLEDFIAGKRKTGVYLSVLGFGRGNLNDLLMQKLAQAGNGNASYIDSLLEARKVLVDEMARTLFPIADDVKIQVEFNPARVAEYRLIGYETRLLAREDFNNDQVDAGEVGSGHAVTALYEITAPDSPSRLVDDLRYGRTAHAATGNADEVAWLRLRYKRPGADESLLIERPIPADIRTAFEDAPASARFAAAIAAFGQVLRQDPHVGDIDFEQIYDLAEQAQGDDPFGYRAEFLRLIRLAEVATPFGAN